jgi:hypothetical protein
MTARDEIRFPLRLWFGLGIAELLSKKGQVQISFGVAAWRWAWYFET